MGKQYISQSKERSVAQRLLMCLRTVIAIEMKIFYWLMLCRYGLLVKLQCYTASHGFEELDTYTKTVTAI